MPNVRHILDRRVTTALRAAFPDVPDAPAIVAPSQDPRFGDYQANGAMGLAKRLKRKPRDVAEAALAHLDVSDLADPPEIAGPGFINFRLRPDWVAAQLGAVNQVSSERPEDDRLGVPPPDRPETVVVDYSAPNLAKEMHVGHLRSTIIGDALARMLDFVGHTVVRQNHVGDWGTQFGMLVAYLERLGRSSMAISELEQFYREAKQRLDQDAQFADESRQAVVRLHAGDPSANLRWALYRTLSMEHCSQLYHRLGVLLTDADIRGESAYNDVLPDIVKALRDKGLLSESEGAQCVFLQSAICNLQSAIPTKPLFVAKDGSPLPFIVQKSDEGYLYATTDLAAIAFRTGHLPPSGNLQSAICNLQSPRADRILYVVDARQSLHFQMLFECARQAEFAPPRVRLEHVAFGTMMGADGRPFKTREGGTVKLMDLLDEAVKRARALVDEKNAGLDEPEREDIARIVSIGAVKYADLSQNRTSDYVFSWDKMLALDGNTAPYMQYAYARVRSIFRKGGHDETALRGEEAPVPLAEPQELALGKMILRFPEAVDRALDDYRPNVLAAYLYDLAGAFTAFYDVCPVIQSPEPVRTHRLKLCDLTARVIERGLGLLGIETAERM